ncbi:transcription factor S-II-domain-containing protein [Microdochium bolleyi]|uniref:DNA-directed RNA polymerase subunit n=1 Tax=Microdochium bolleyi TaxID=196109 RepID=A0A136JDN4_9PEZI|nr:transcription factor S-II-domain-containing protein [Microdochium bolleyi]
MATIGSLIFCKTCGNLLPVSKGNEKNVLECECCGTRNQDMASKTVTTKSKPSDFPSLLRQQLSTTQTVERHKVQTEALSNVPCEKCGETNVRYSAVQLRSADEGSTIFYTCGDCGHKWNTNN